jgi:hypothetical protein
MIVVFAFARAEHGHQLAFQYFLLAWHADQIIDNCGE